MKTKKIMVLILAFSLSACATISKEAPTADSANEATTNIQSAITRGDAALNSGDLDRALFEYVEVLKLDTDNAEILYKVAVIHSAKGNLNLAENAYLKVLDQDKQHAGASEGLGLVLLNQGKHALALERLEPVVAADPSRWRAQNALGVIYDLQNDYERASEHYQAALKEKPALPMLLNNLGYSRYLAGDWDAARSYYDQVLAQEPKNQKAWSNLGLLYVRQDNFDKALAAFREIMDEPQALNNVGYICMIDGKFDQAEVFFLKAIQTAPSYYTIAHQNLLRSRTERGNTNVSLEEATAQSFPTLEGGQ